MDDGSKLEAYVLLAKGARGRALVDLIQKVIAEPGIFTFGELFDVPSVQELANGEHAQAYHLLQLYAYGTLTDYRASRGVYPALTEQQLLKLRLLTVISTAETDKTIGYARLLDALGLGNIRELEDLLITDAFHSGIIAGKLDQHQQCLQVHESIGRDVRPGQLQPVLDGISSWMSTCGSLLDVLDERRRWVVQAAEAAEAAKKEAEKSVEDAKKSLKSDADVQEGMLVDDVPGPSADLMDEDRIGAGSGRPKRRR